MLLRRTDRNPFANAIFFVDAWIMHVGDLLLLLLWNQFSVERIKLLRFATGVYLAVMVIDFGESLISKPSFGGGIAISVMLLLGFAVFGFIHLTNEFYHKQHSKTTQNVRALYNRVALAWLRLLIGVIFTMVVFGRYMSNDSPLWMDVIVTFQQIAWVFIMVGNHLFISENPPKRWKLKIKLPSFSFNSPLPQGA